MTNQTEFTPEIKAEAERLWADAYLSLNGLKPRTPQRNGVAIRALCNLLVATGFKPPVDPIEAKAREIVADQLDATNCPKAAERVREGDLRALRTWQSNLTIAKAGILAGMEMGKP